MRVAVRPLLLALVVLASSVPASAQAPTDEQVIAVIQRNSIALPAAYREWNLMGLGEFLTGTELDRRRADIQRMAEEGAELWPEQRDFVVVTVATPSSDRAIVDTMETWYEWASLAGVAAERTWTAPQRYELQLVGGRWYISDIAILAELPAFMPITPAAPVAEPQPPPAPAAPPAMAPAPAPAPAPTAAPARPSCCRVCTGGQACGNSCIARNLNCRQPPGCACQGAVAPSFATLLVDAAPLLAFDTLALGDADVEASCPDDQPFGVAFPGSLRMHAL